MECFHVMTSISTSTGSPSTASAWSGRTWGLLMTLCIVLFLDGLDVSMIGVALPSIGTELDLSTSSLQWLVSGYVLGYGGLLLLGGRTADLLGRRKVFLIALAVFAIASLAGGLVTTGPLLILTRFVKGLAAAFTAPPVSRSSPPTSPRARPATRLSRSTPCSARVATRSAWCSVG